MVVWSALPLEIGASNIAGALGSKARDGREINMLQHGVDVEQLS